MDDLPKKITSPITGTDKCFIETFNGIDSYMCMDSGYTTNSTYKCDSDVIRGVEKSAPKIIKDLKFVDKKLGLVWYPSVMQIPGVGMIFPDGSDKDNWGWSVAKEVKLNEEEQKKYPIPSKKGEFYKSKLDMENLKSFDKDKFELACEEIGLIRE
tara:strand:+ start:433 stop:897 length:465 start_codon:yes stop_codon:yes gene_type:complete